MNKTKTKEEILQYVYDYGIDKASDLLRLTPEQIDKILNSELATIYLHKSTYKNLPVSSMVADIIAKNYYQLRSKFVKNPTNLYLSQSEEDIFHNTLIKVIEETDIIEDKILEHIKYRLKMVRYQTVMDNQQLKKVVSNALSE